MNGLATRRREDDMISRQIGRRALLLGSCGLAGAVLALAGAARTARAFSLVDMDPNTPVGLAYANRCKIAPQQGHADLLAKLAADLATKTGAQGTYIYETAVCPICGCPVTAKRYIN
jgi:hypothetical protein